jgi:hypothetical protein
VGWDRQTFEKLVARQPEPLVSRFDVTHGLLLNLLQADAREPGRAAPRRGSTGFPPVRGAERGGGYGRLVRIVRRAHVTETRKKQLLVKSAVLFRTLRAAGLVSTFKHPYARSAEVEVSPDLQRDFSLHHTLSLYLLDSLPRLDRGAVTTPRRGDPRRVDSRDPGIVLLKQLATR